jgi:arsenate reductase (glutaredoxin)
MVTIYGIKNCNTMQKAFDALLENGVEYEFHDYKKSGISEEKIKTWFAKENRDRFINKQGLTWKKLPQEVRDNIGDDSNAISVMANNTSLIRRPIIETPKGLIIGFDEEAIRQL